MPCRCRGTVRADYGGEVADPSRAVLLRLALAVVLAPRLPRGCPAPERPGRRGATPAQLRQPSQTPRRLASARRPRAWFDYRFDREHSKLAAKEAARRCSTRWRRRSNSPVQVTARRAGGVMAACWRARQVASKCVARAATARPRLWGTLEGGCYRCYRTDRRLMTQSRPPPSLLFNTQTRAHTRILVRGTPGPRALGLGLRVPYNGIAFLRRTRRATCRAATPGTKCPHGSTRQYLEGAQPRHSSSAGRGGEGILCIRASSATATAASFASVVT